MALVKVTVEVRPDEYPWRDDTIEIAVTRQGEAEQAIADATAEAAAHASAARTGTAVKA